MVPDLILLLERRCPHLWKQSRHKVGPKSNFILGQEKCCMAYAKSILVCLRVCKDRGPVQGLWSQRTLVFQVLPLYPLNLGSAQLLILDLPLFFLVCFFFLPFSLSYLPLFTWLAP